MAYVNFNKIIPLQLKDNFLSCLLENDNTIVTARFMKYILSFNLPATYPEPDQSNPCPHSKYMAYITHLNSRIIAE
jgi:hypothetical protein